MGKKETKAKGALEWKNASGPIDYTMTNDYMFRMVLQNNKQVAAPLTNCKKAKIITVQYL